VLLDQLSSDDESVRQASADALADLTGRPYGVNISRWRDWWELHKEITNEHWMEERLAFQASRSRRLEGELDRAKSQLLTLHQQLYSRLPVADRLGLIQNAADSEDPSIRSAGGYLEHGMLPTVDAVGQTSAGRLLLRFSHDGTVEVQRAAVWRWAGFLIRESLIGCVRYSRRVRLQCGRQQRACWHSKFVGRGRKPLRASGRLSPACRKPWTILRWKLLPKPPRVWEAWACLKQVRC